MRSARRRREIALEDHADVVAEVLHRRAVFTDNTSAAAIRTEGIWRAVAALPEAQRLVLLLRAQHDLSYKEIAAVRGCTAGTARSLMHQAVRNVRKALVPGEDGPEASRS